jgi:hypothetical protein
MRFVASFIAVASTLPILNIHLALSFLREVIIASKTSLTCTKSQICTPLPNMIGCPPLETS